MKHLNLPLVLLVLSFLAACRKENEFSSENFKEQKKQIQIPFCGIDNPIAISMMAKQYERHKFDDIAARKEKFPQERTIVFINTNGGLVQRSSWGIFPVPAVSVSSSEIALKVSEHLSQYKVIVTTDSAVYKNAASGRKMIVYVTNQKGTELEMYPPAGGYAFIGSFYWTNEDPTIFVFADRLGTASNLAEASAHELGHAIGLYHLSVWDDDCSVLLNPYYPVFFKEDYSFGTVMGNSYNANFRAYGYGATQLGCTDLQNDHEKLTAAFGTIPDDFPDKIEDEAKKRDIPKNSKILVAGIINNDDDKDVIKFSSKKKLSITAISGGSTKLKFSVYDECHKLIGTSVNSVPVSVPASKVFYIAISGDNPRPLLNGGRYTIEATSI